MKKIMLSALAVGCAIVGVTATKANNSRVSTIFHFNKALSAAPTPATLTNVANWSIVGSTPSCVSGTQVPCYVTPPASITTVSQLTAGIRTNGGTIPAAYNPVLKLTNTL